MHASNYIELFVHDWNANRSQGRFHFDVIID